jgi:superfamily II DNA or RNA helicase
LGYLSHVASTLRPGAYDQLVTIELAEKIRDLPAGRVLREALEFEESPEILARHLKFLFRRAISAISDSDDPLTRIRISNQIVQALKSISPEFITDADLIEESSEPILWAVSSPQSFPDDPVTSPSIRLSDSDLLVNGRNQPSIGHEINKELQTADRVDLLCSFVMYSGVRVLERQIAQLIQRGSQLRILTTTYMGTTERKALDQLSALGAQIRISYDSTTTRLHAKAWLLHRDSGATTAYIGSSNLSRTALVDGIEWNVRVSAREQEHIISSVAATFENYWNDPEFAEYNPQTDADRLDFSLANARRGGPSTLSLNFANIEVTPRPFQQEVLDSLEFQRKEKGRTCNLVAMATGTGKTVVAGLDFRRLVDSGEVSSLLFIAHRKEILQQSLTTFRTIMRSGTFGQLLVDGQRPTEWTHVFGSIQSLKGSAKEELAPEAFDMIIIDEFHHAAADSYEEVLQHFQPKYLLGLTATPERPDGRPILQWFDNSVSAELRLWEAIDRQILCPFQYFGIHDNTDLEAANIKWTRGQGYDVQQLTNLYTANDSRVALVLEQLNRYVPNLGDLRGLGFCVSVDHAKFMADRFLAAGLPSVSVTSSTNIREREQALNDLRSGAIKVIFCVDIFNEGVDIPDVNTLLMLRPTESATVFLQQLGRGLRKSDSKNCLVVLDFVGNQNRNFRFDKKYGSLLGVGRHKLAEEISANFPRLPIGCHIELDRVSQRIVLQNIRESLRLNRNTLLSELRNLGQVSAFEFFSSTGIAPKDFYRSGRTLMALKKELFGGSALSDTDDSFAKVLPKFLHVDDPQRLNAYSAILAGLAPNIEDSYIKMFSQLAFGRGLDLPQSLDEIARFSSSPLAEELSDLLKFCDENRARVTKESRFTEIPLKIHATYTRPEIVTAFGETFTGAERAGVQHVRGHKADLAFVTLNKTDAHFSPSTMYADTALSPTIFQWESQSRTTSLGETGRRYINHSALGTSFHLFVREWKNDPETKSTMPFMYFGPASYLSHEGDRPMRIKWKLDVPLPADVFVRSKVIAS